MNRIKWIPIIFLFLLLPIRIFAQSACLNPDQSTCLSISDPEQKVICYQNEIQGCKNKSDTLAGEISYFNNQIKLTTLRVSATQTKISTLQTEIGQLEDEVVRLEEILNKRLALLLHRIPESYKRAATPQFGLLLFSRDFSDFISRVKYIMTVQNEDAALVFQVKATQNSYNERKIAREEKKSELDKIKSELVRQNAQLAAQKQEKDSLLAVTQGNEERYSQLLAAARAQLVAINSFVSSLGGATVLSNQTYKSDWGTYYNQRDSSWWGHFIGSSPETVGNVGCLVTSIAMVMTHYGRSVSPADVASTPGLFVPGTAYMYQGTRSIAGASVTRTSVSYGTIDSELAAGRPVIVGVYNGPGHFVVLKSGSGGNYIMNDPFVENGHDISFSSHYSPAIITEIDTVRVN